MMTRQPATRIDPDTGCREEVMYFGAHSPLMFGTTHLPAGEAIAGVIICSSLHAELIKSYRKEALLGRALAEAGVAVQRYHYRGAGNSEGENDERDVDEMIESVVEAREHLASRIHVDRFGYMGTRIGAFPATAAACDTPGAPLALWSPILDADAFMREVIRSHYIAAIKGAEKPEPTDRMMERLETEGSIELLGYRIGKRFHDSLAGRRLAEFTPKDCPVLFVPLGPSNFDEITEAWIAVGADVTSQANAGQEAWWLANDPTVGEDGQDRTQMLIEGTTRWLVSQLAG